MYRPGDIVELDGTRMGAPPAHPESPLQDGMRGTVVSRLWLPGRIFWSYTVDWQTPSGVLTERTSCNMMRLITRPGESTANPPGSETRFAKKRRLLREHRDEMRVMESVLEHHDVMDAVEDYVERRLDRSMFWLGDDPGPGGMDEGDDEEDPEAELMKENEALRGELRDRGNLMSAVMGVASSNQYNTLKLEFERARMQLEDMRSRAGC